MKKHLLPGFDGVEVTMEGLGLDELSLFPVRLLLFCFSSSIWYSGFIH